MGSYRRGKPASNDIDIVFTHGNATSAKDLCARLVERLRSAGLVTHTMREYRLAFILFPPTRAWLTQISPVSMSTMRYARHIGTRLRRHSQFIERPKTASTIRSI
jgi:hypothetical protein